MILTTGPLRAIALNAGRNLLRARVRNVLTVIGIAVSASLLVLLLAFTEGLEGIARRELLGALDLRSVTVFSAADGSPLNDDAVSRLSQFPGVQRLGLRMTRPAIVTFNGKSSPMNLLASDFETPPLVAGRQIGRDDADRAVVVASLGRVDSIAPPELLEQEIRVQPRRFSFDGGGARLVPVGDEISLHIVGVAADEAGSRDVRVSLELLRLIATRAGDRVEYSSIVLTASGPQEALALDRLLRNEGYGSVAKKAQIDEVTKMFGIVRVLLSAVAAIALVIACIGVVNTMLMAILERTREIGLLRAIGASTGFLRALFVLEGAALGLAGALLGSAASITVAAVLTPAVRAQVEAIAPLGPGDLFQVSPGLVIISIVVVTAFSAVAALIPSERAARLEPVRALRND